MRRRTVAQVQVDQALIRNAYIFRDCFEVTDRFFVPQLAAPSAHGVPTVEHPEAHVKHIVRGIVSKELMPVPSKSLLSLRVDQDVLAWFKSQGTGYQTPINAVLRAFRDAST